MLTEDTPPIDQPVATLANWQVAPHNRWAFSHMDELVPVLPIHGARAAARAFPSEPHALGNVVVNRTDSTISSADAVWDDTFTDAVCVIHDGKVVYERYFGETGIGTPHLLMSVTKSVVGTVTGILIDKGVLSADDPITRWIPELELSGYVGATVRNILDMRSGVRFSEEYTNPNAEVRVMEEAMGWRPATQHGVGGSMYAYLPSLQQDSGHGGPFRYRSCETDVLGWVCERAAHRSMADLISDLIWVPMGAEFDAHMTCDLFGAPIHDGGMCATARDLARFGWLILNDGEFDGKQIIPEDWVRASWKVDPDIREAFARSASGPYMPGAWYRNQFWFLPREHGDVLLCLGIHGQMLYVNPGTRVVAAKLSTWPEAQDVRMLYDTLSAFDAIGANLSGLGPSTGVTHGLPGIAVGLLKGLAQHRGDRDDHDEHPVQAD